jgi:TRAP-type mannitol/chloroaromatic compound transport system substrate-binding protein
MKRLVFKALLILSILLFVASPSLSKEKVIKWKVQGFVPAGMIFHDLLVHTAEEVEKLTDGRLIWEIHPGGALVPPMEGLKAVSDGVYDVNYGYAGMWIGKIPVAPLFSSVPGGFNSYDTLMWQEHGGGKELYQEMFDRYGYKVKAFHGAPISMENFMWAKKPIRTLEDFKGLRMRMMPLMGDVLTSHGLSVVFMPGGEIMPSLQRGVIDAAEFACSCVDKTLGIWEVCKYIMLPGIHQPAGCAEILINKKAYNALPDDLKVKVEAAISNARFKDWLWMESENLKAVEFFKKKGIETVMMDPKTVKTMVGWAHEYLDKKAEEDEFFAKVWNSQKAFGKQWYPFAREHNLPH